MKKDEFQSLINKAQKALKTSSLKEAEEQFAAAQELLKAQKDSQEKDSLSAVIENGFFSIASRKGDHDQARERADKALELSRKAEDKNSESKALHNIGIANYCLSQYAEALGFYQKSLEIKEEIGDKQGMAASLGNMGIIYSHLTDYGKSLEFYQKALEINEAIGDKHGIAINLGNIGIVYRLLSDYDKALEFYQKARGFNEDSGDKQGVATNLGNIGGIYSSLSDYPKALEFFQKALEIKVEIGDKHGEAVNLSNIGKVYIELSDYSKALEFFRKALDIREEIGDKNGEVITLVNLGNIFMKISPPDFKASEEKLNKALTICKSIGIKREEAECFKSLSELCRLQERWKEADEYYRHFHEVSTQVFTLEAKKQADNFVIQQEIQEKEKQQAIEHAAKEARHQATESLLQRVLPFHIAERILEGEDQIADYHASASILFADIQGFTALTADLPPYMLLQLLHTIFTRFDKVVKEAGCTKIKTIGDGYLVVSGAPEKCDDHAERIVHAAKEMIKPIEIPAEVSAFMPEDAELKMRIGIHLGPVIAGVVGQDAFGYDIYSDAVNIASRMESNGEAGRIHVSADFMRHLLSRFAMTKNHDHGITFEKRGEIEVKGKGKMKTFFLGR